MKAFSFIFFSMMQWKIYTVAVSPSKGKVVS